LSAWSSFVLIQRQDWFRLWASPAATFSDSAAVWTMALRMVTASSIIAFTRAWSWKIPHGTWQCERACMYTRIARRDKVRPFKTGRPRELQEEPQSSSGRRGVEQAAQATYHTRAERAPVSVGGGGEARGSGQAGTTESAQTISESGHIEAGKRRGKVFPVRRIFSAVPEGAEEGILILRSARDLRCTK
jgi:hypothetical protein